MTVRVEWLGLKLPKSHPVIALSYRFLPKREQEAIDAVEAAAGFMIRFHAKTEFRVGPPQGFSQWYQWTGGNRYIARMTESDAAILFRGGIIEFQQFRDVDRPDHARREAPYPSEVLMQTLRVHDTRDGTWRGVTIGQARIVARLLKRAMRTPLPTVEQEIGARVNAPFLDPDLALARLR